jgi:hypothetical protein
MKLTARNGIYAKRIKPLVKFLHKYLDASEENVNTIIIELASLVRYFKANAVYITGGRYKLEIDTHPSNECCTVMLNTFIEDGAVHCKDEITLLFPCQ